jgi:two-component system cell cycle sensor histidine kinase/response regulator CckA
VRAVAARTLADRGALIVEAADGDEALRLFDEHADVVDVVLTDVVMPGMSGIELAATLRRERPALPVVYTSGSSDEDVELPDDAVLVCKPFTGDDLVAAIAEVLPVSFLAER